jgi:hypothetical protein
MFALNAGPRARGAGVGAPELRDIPWNFFGLMPSSSTGVVELSALRYTHIETQMHVSVCVYIRVRMYTRTCVFICIYVCVCLCVCVISMCCLQKCQEEVLSATGRAEEGLRTGWSFGAA